MSPERRHFIQVPSLWLKICYNTIKLKSQSYNRKERILGATEVASDRFERMLSHCRQGKKVGKPTLGK